MGRAETDLNAEGGGKWFFFPVLWLTVWEGQLESADAEYWSSQMLPWREIPVKLSSECSEMQCSVGCPGSDNPQERAVGCRHLGEGPTELETWSSCGLAPPRSSRYQNGEELSSSSQEAHGVLQAEHLRFQPHSQKPAWISVKLKRQPCGIINYPAINLWHAFWDQSTWIWALPAHFVCQWQQKNSLKWTF